MVAIVHLCFLADVAFSPCKKAAGIMSAAFLHGLDRWVGCAFTRAADQQYINKKGRPIGTTGYQRDSPVFFLVDGNRLTLHSTLLET